MRVPSTQRKSDTYFVIPLYRHQAGHINLQWSPNPRARVEHLVLRSIYRSPSPVEVSEEHLSSPSIAVSCPYTCSISRPISPLYEQDRVLFTHSTTRPAFCRMGRTPAVKHLVHHWSGLYTADEHHSRSVFIEALFLTDHTQQPIWLIFSCIREIPACICEDPQVSGVSRVLLCSPEHPKFTM
jgi:hypothetical protein